MSAVKGSVKNDSNKQTLKKISIGLLPFHTRVPVDFLLIHSPARHKFSHFSITGNGVCRSVLVHYSLECMFRWLEKKLNLSSFVINNISPLQDLFASLRSRIHK
jgi:hypothetical protein